jgi:guanylate kinase
MEELRRRLESRDSDDADSRGRRFDKAREEIGHYPFFDYMIVNDELQRALAELRGIVLAEGCRQWRAAAKAEALLQE